MIDLVGLYVANPSNIAAGVEWGVVYPTFHPESKSASNPKWVSGWWVVGPTFDTESKSASNPKWVSGWWVVDPTFDTESKSA